MVIASQNSCTPEGTPEEVTLARRTKASATTTAAAITVDNTVSTLTVKPNHSAVLCWPTSIVAPARIVSVIASHRPRSSCSAYAPSPMTVQDKGWSLSGPCPVGDVGNVSGVLAGPGSGPQPGIDHVLAQCGGGGAQGRDPVDDVDDQAVAVQVVKHHHVERRCRGAAFLVAANVQTLMIGAPVGEPVNQPQVAVEGEND